MSHKITNVYSNRSVIFGNRPSFQLRFTLFSNPLTLRPYESIDLILFSFASSRNGCVPSTPQLTPLLRPFHGFFFSRRPHTSSHFTTLDITLGYRHNLFSLALKRNRFTWMDFANAGTIWWFVASSNRWKWIAFFFVQGLQDRWLQIW